jgi:hypothetical protein
MNSRTIGSEMRMKHRLGGALRLESRIYAAARDDPRAWGEALLVVLAVALAHGLGALLRAGSQPYSERALWTFLFGFQGEILLWLGISASLYLVARLLLRHAVSFGQVARPIGFAALPGIGVVVAGALSGLGLSALPVLVVLLAWRLAATFVAVQQALATTFRVAAALLLVGIIGGMGLMAGGTALLNYATPR